MEFIRVESAFSTRSKRLSIISSMVVVVEGSCDGVLGRLEVRNAISY